MAPDHRQAPAYWPRVHDLQDPPKPGAVEKKGARTMTEEEWVQRALADCPPMSATKKARLALLFREEPPVAQVLRLEHHTPPTHIQGELDHLGDDHAAAI